MIKTARLLQLCSQALPVGAYAYSAGLESAIESGLVQDVDSSKRWIADMMRYGLAELDLPALLIAHEAWVANDIKKVEALDVYLQASRETQELLLEDQQMGRSLRKLLGSFGIDSGDGPAPSFVTQFACAGVAWRLDVDDLIAGFCFSWLENQVGVATKSIPLGQTNAQILLAELALLIDCAAAIADKRRIESVDGWDFGVSLPSLAILSSRHETLENRLYRS